MRSFVLTLVVFFSLASSANKSFFGGCWNGAEICDEAILNKMKAIPISELSILLENEFGQLFDSIPQLRNHFLILLAKKQWFTLDEEITHPECQPQTLSTSHYEVVACQSQFEVVFEKEFWTNAAEATKAKLLLHELLGIEAMTKDWEWAQVRSIVMDLLREDFSSVERRDLIHSKGLPEFWAAQEKTSTTLFLLPHATRLCRQLAEGKVDPKYEFYAPSDSDLTIQSLNIMPSILTIFMEQPDLRKCADQDETWLFLEWSFEEAWEKAKRPPLF